MTALPPSTLNPVPREIEALRAELCEARGAQQTAEVALAHEREANVAEGVRAAINDAVRSQWDACDERDRVQEDYRQAYALFQDSQRSVLALKQELVDILLENRLLQRENMELAAISSYARYSPLSHTTSAPRYRFSQLSTTHSRLRTPIPKSTRPSASRPIPPSSPFSLPTALLTEESPILPSYDDPSAPSWSHNSSTATLERHRDGLGPI